MVVEEALVVGIVEGMIVCCIEHSGIAPWIREKIKGEPEKTALKNAVRNAATTFEGKYPDWTASLFDLSFFQREGAPILAEFLVSDGNPSADELVQRWAASLPARATADRDAYIRTLEPVAADFLGMMAHELKAQPVLRELNNARALERAVAALIAIQARIGADHASPATRRAYLHWLIERNEYLDPRGTVEVEHAVHVKLDEIYVSLTASRDDAISSTERKRIEQELADLAEKTAGTSLSVVEMDDRRD